MDHIDHQVGEPTLQSQRKCTAHWAYILFNFAFDIQNPAAENAFWSCYFLSFPVSDFTHSLSKLHEQQAEDLHTLVEEFRHKNADLRNERPACTNSLFNTWECLLNETESDAQVHTDIAGVLGRAVSRPLLEKTFHMKIQSRSVFIHRESFETILDKTEQMLLKVRIN